MKRFQCRLRSLRDGFQNRMRRIQNQEVSRILKSRDVFLGGDVFFERRVIIEMFGDDVQEYGDVWTGLDFCQLVARKLMNEIAARHRCGQPRQRRLSDVSYEFCGHTTTLKHLIDK